MDCILYDVFIVSEYNISDDCAVHDRVMFVERHFVIVIVLKYEILF